MRNLFVRQLNGLGADPGGVTVYTKTSYQGNPTLLPPGDYTSAKLASMGIADKTIRSVHVSIPYTFEIFDGPNLTGTSAVFTQDDDGIHSNKLTSGLVLGANAIPSKASSVRVRSIAQDVVSQVADQQLVSSVIDPTTKKIAIFGAVGIGLLALVAILVPGKK